MALSAYADGAHDRLSGGLGRETDGRIRLATQPLAQALNEKRSELMFGELEAVALRLFEEHGFNAVTVQAIASEAKISVRTFYRYFPAKEDVLQVRILSLIHISITVEPDR